MSTGTQGTLRWVAIDREKSDADTSTVDLPLQASLMSTGMGIMESGQIGEKLRSGELMLSVVIPMYNEEDNLDALHLRLTAEIEKTAPNCEVILVDDGSKDRSFAKASEIWAKDDRFTVLRLRANSGKAAALMAGFDRVHGDIVLMLDADLQDQPEELAKMIAKLDEGYDLVTGWKIKRLDPVHKTMPSKLFNKTVADYYDLQIHDMNCGYKLMKAEVAKNLRIYGDYHRFIPVLAQNMGYKVAEQAVAHAPRVAGVSKYGAKRLFTGLLDFWSSMIATRYRTKPLQFFGAIGGVMILLSLAFAILGIVGNVAQHAATPVWITSGALLVGGLNFVGIGLLAELVVFYLTKQTKVYELSDDLHRPIAGK